MSLKLILPMAGSVGMIASVAGVSTSSYRSGDSANKDPIHKWKIEIPREIEVEFDCKGNLVNDIFATGITTNTKLKLSWLLGEDDLEQLKDGKVITRNGFVNFFQQGVDTKMWPITSGDKESKLTVTIPREGKKIKIEFSVKTGTSARSGATMRSEWTDSTFECAWRELREKSNQRQIYAGNTTLLSGKWMTSTKNTDISSKNSIANCNPSEAKDKKTAICDLKVVTGTGLKGLYWFEVCVF